MPELFGRARLPRSLAFPPIPHVWLRPLPLYEKHPSLFGEGCFWLGWQGSGMFLPKGPEHWGPALTRKARMGAQRSPGALLLRPSPTSGFDPCLYTKSTPPFSGRGAFGWAGRGQECSCPKGRNIGALRSRAKPGWARNAPPEPCFSAHPPRLASTPSFVQKSTAPLSGSGAFGWAGRGRTYDVGVKVPCLTAWRQPNIRKSELYFA